MPTFYWDASAVLPTLFRDEHSEQALEWAEHEGVHLLSSPCHAEVAAVIARIRRERALTDVLVDAAKEALSTGPWRRLNLLPGWSEIERLAERWPLRGADLWHLATASTLAEELDNVVLRAFDTRLAAAAEGEGLGG